MVLGIQPSCMEGSVISQLDKPHQLRLLFSPRIFSVLSAILYLGNVTYKKRATGRDEGLEVGPPKVLDTLSQLLKVTLPALSYHGACWADSEPMATEDPELPALAVLL